MFAISPSAQGQNFIFVIVAAVIGAVFWRTILKIGVTAVIIVYVFVLVTGLHGRHAPIP